MKELLNQEQLIRLDKLINRCKKIQVLDLDIYEQMDKYKCYKDAPSGIRDAVFNYVMNELGLQNKYRKPMVFGYIRVSTTGQMRDGNSLEHQKQILIEKGVPESNIYQDAYTGSKMKRPNFDKLIQILKSGDTLIVSKLDRIARTAIEGAELVNSLIERGVTINIANMGIMDNTPTSKLVRTMFFGFAEFERDMILERTLEGKAIAKLNPNYREGRPAKLTEEDIDKVVELSKTMSYQEIADFLKISKSTIYRAMRKRKAEEQKSNLERKKNVEEYKK